MRGAKGVVMDLHHLKIFLSVFKNRSFSKASRELNLTQPTISDHIQTLENELKCRLFDRLGRTILPTKEAEVLNPYAAEVIEKAEALKEVVGNLKKEIAGELMIGASNIPGTYLIPSLLASFPFKDVCHRGSEAQHPEGNKDQGAPSVR